MTTTLAFARRIAAVVGLAVLLLAALPAPAHASPSAAPVSFPTTDGDILASTVLYLGSYNALAVGGNFHHIRQPSGALVAADNVAVLRIPDGAVLYAGHANSYVRALHAIDSRLYIGGSFTSLDGKARNKVASVTAPGWALTPFAAPGVGTVYSITAGGGTGIVVGSSSSVRSFSPDTSQQRWTVPVTGGPVRAMVTVPGMYPGVDVVYVGGQFETAGDLAQHGLVRLGVTATGAFVDHAFTPYLRPDSGVGLQGSYDGQEVLSLGIKQPDPQLMIGWGGATDNGVGSTTLEYSHWWWQKQTPGDLQALGVLPTTTIIGYHRNHANDPVPDEAGERWLGTEVDSSYAFATAWDPKLTGSTPGNADGGNHGITTISVDYTNRMVFTGGGFMYVGADCPSTVWPCVNPVGSPSRSLAAWRW